MVPWLLTNKLTFKLHGNLWSKYLHLQARFMFDINEFVTTFSSVFIREQLASQLSPNDIFAKR